MCLFTRFRQGFKKAFRWCPCTGKYEDHDLLLQHTQRQVTRMTRTITDTTDVSKYAYNDRNGSSNAKQLNTIADRSTYGSEKVKNGRYKGFTRVPKEENCVWYWLSSACMQICLCMRVFRGENSFILLVVQNTAFDNGVYYCTSGYVNRQARVNACNLVCCQCVRASR